MKFYKIVITTASVFLIGACSASKEITYFQDLTPGESEIELASSSEIKIMPLDKLSIIVTSQNPKLTNLFNLPMASRQIGSESSSNSSNGGVLCYTVDSQGDIEFPILGTVHVGGMTRKEVATHIKQKLQSREQVTDPVVTVDFVNLTVSVLGEVDNPGRYSIDKDKVTVLDALSQAGDLTIQGKRNNVMVLRTEEGMQRVYAIDLRSAKNLYSSPAYYLQQNDVIYVEPNGTKARQSTVNGNTVRSTSFWFSLVSLLTTLVVLIVK